MTRMPLTPLNQHVARYLEGVHVKKILQLFVSHIDAHLLKAVGLEILETKNV